MGFLTPDKKGGEDETEAGRGLELDLDVKACPVCRRELLPWQETCPEDGAGAVARADLPPADGPAVPDHLLDEGPDRNGDQPAG